VSDLDLDGLIAAAAPQGAAQDADSGLTVIVPVWATDATGRRVQVSWRGALMWLPALPGRYRVAAVGIVAPQGLARVLLDPVAGRPVLVLGPVDPRATAVAGTMTASGASTCTVTLDGATYTLPFQAATYGTLPKPVLVLLDDWGTPMWVLGPSAIADQSQAAPTPPPAAPAPVQATTSVGPQWSGTWRVDRSAWDRWNTGDYGGRSDLYQGSDYGSGTLIGLATYGDQLVNLGATSFDKVTLTAKRNGSGGGSVALTVRGSASGSQPAGAPSSSGTSAATSAAAPGGWVSVDLPSDVCEAMRTGATKGLAAVGGTYAGWGGTGTPGSMVLAVTYTRPA